MGLQSDFDQAWDAWSSILNTFCGDLVTDRNVLIVTGSYADQQPNWWTPQADNQFPQLLSNMIWLWQHGGFTTQSAPGWPSSNDLFRSCIVMGMVCLEAMIKLADSMSNIALSVDVLNSQVAGLQASTGGVTAAWVEQLFNNAVADAEELFNDEVSWRTTAVANAEQQATAQVQQAEQQATAQYNQATSYSQQLYNQAVAHADQDMATAEQQATNQHNQAEQDAQNAANQAQSNAQGYTDGAVRGAEALAAAALALQVASDAVEFATLTAGVAAVADLAGDAIMANGLLQLLEAGAFFGFLALAIKEPVGTANVSVGVLDPLLDQAGALVDDVIGFLV